MSYGTCHKCGADCYVEFGPEDEAGNRLCCCCAATSALEAERDQARAERDGLKRSYELTSSYLETANARVAELERTTEAVAEYAKCFHVDTSGLSLEEIVRRTFHRIGEERDKAVWRVQRLESGERFKDIQSDYEDCCQANAKLSRGRYNAQQHARRWKALAKMYRMQLDGLTKMYESTATEYRDVVADAARLREVLRGIAAVNAICPMCRGWMHVHNHNCPFAAALKEEK